MVETPRYGMDDGNEDGGVPRKPTQQAKSRQQQQKKTAIY